MLFQHQICISLNGNRTISNILVNACARLVAVLPHYSTLSTSRTSDSVLATFMSTETLSSISDRARKQAEPPIEYRPPPLSVVVHIVCFRHSRHCAVSNEKGILSADHSPDACGATYDMLGEQLYLYKPGRIFTAV
jgi:hypothetical protein